ncbi:MAG: ABC transporter permease [Candidatus Competibacterales bacterium]
MKRLINRRPTGALWAALVALPFVALVVGYTLGSSARLAANPNDKLLPAPATMAQTVQRLATQPSRRSGELVLWRDTAASLQRLGLGLAISGGVGLVLGVLIGAIPYVNALLGAFVTALAMVPPLALLPILFIVFGLGEVSKVALIAIGTAPFVVRDLSQRVAELPAEQLIKAQTLGASTWQIILRVIVPQTLPRLLEALRLSLGAAWLFLIAAEAIAATDGLGYRIFLVRRYLDMATIIPYVLWITLLAFALDAALRLLGRWWFPWQYTPRP